MSNPSPSWKFSETDTPNVHLFDLDFKRVGDEISFLLMSDVHWDNPHCDRALLHKHLKQAKERNAPVLDAGDFHCAMQGKFDPRGSKRDIRPEHMGGDYLDLLVETAAEDLAPYKDILTVRGYGNHETSIQKRHETSLVDRLAAALRARGGISRTGGYGGWVKFQCRVNGGEGRKSFTLSYFHGSGGGGIMSHGTLETRRRASFIDADVLWSGHTHDQWTVVLQRIGLNQRNEPIQSRQYHIRTPGYKNEYGIGAGGFHIERGAPPKPLGAQWLTITMAHSGEFELSVKEAF